MITFRLKFCKRTKDWHIKGNSAYGFPIPYKDKATAIKRAKHLIQYIVDQNGLEIRLVIHCKNGSRAKQIYFRKKGTESNEK